MKSDVKRRVVFCRSSSLCAEGDVLRESRYGAVEPYELQWVVPGRFKKGLPGLAAAFSGHSLLNLSLRVSLSYGHPPKTAHQVAWTLLLLTFEPSCVCPCSHPKTSLPLQRRQRHCLLLVRVPCPQVPGGEPGQGDGGQAEPGPEVEPPPAKPRAEGGVGHRFP